MNPTASIAELQHAGVTLDPGEAVAVAQQLIQSLRSSDDAGGIEPPYGPPTAANVTLSADGSVSCAACGTMPAISEIAIFLDTLLPPGSSRVPGGLRYTIARGLLEVDVAPFDSLDDFSQALGRYEGAPRGEVIRGLLRRAAAAGARGDRRRARTTELRRALREADAQLYEQQPAARGATRTAALVPYEGRGIPALSQQDGQAGDAAGSLALRATMDLHRGPLATRIAPPIRTRTVPAIAVCLGSGLMMIAAGEFVLRQPSRPPAAPPLAPLAAVRIAAASPMTLIALTLPPNSRAAEPRRIERRTGAMAFQPGAGAVARPLRPVPATPSTFGRTDRASLGPPARTAGAVVRKARSPRTSHGILDRLRLRWLRQVFSVTLHDL